MKNLLEKSILNPHSLSYFYTSIYYSQNLKTTPKSKSKVSSKPTHSRSKLLVMNVQNIFYTYLNSYTRSNFIRTIKIQNHPRRISLFPIQIQIHPCINCQAQDVCWFQDKHHYISTSNPLNLNFLR
mgnify:CR=1 FL=1